jgi:hypothetical protein
MVHTGLLDLGCSFEAVPTNAREIRASVRKPLGKTHFRHIGYFLTIFFVLIQVASGQSVPSDNSTLPDKPEPSDQSHLAYPANQPYQTNSADLAEQDNPTDPADQQPHRPRVVQQSGGDFYRPITPGERLQWLVTSTLGPSHLLAGTVVAGIRTAEDHPVEYGTHWGGFADRFGMRMSGIATGNTMEAGLGYLLGEDPRYFRAPDESPMARIGNVVRQTFVARHNDGAYGLAYARYMAIAGNNFLSKTWRVPSEANTHAALVRIGEGFAGRIVSNAFKEFWPDLKRLVIHNKE